MRIEITARHMVLPESVQEMLRTKLQKLERLDEKIVSIHAIFGKEKHLFTVELTLAGKGLRLAAKGKHSKDLLTAMEQALEKIERQLKKEEKKKRVESRRRVEHR